MKARRYITVKDFNKEFGCIVGELVEAYTEDNLIRCFVPAKDDTLVRTIAKNVCHALIGKTVFEIGVLEVRDKIKFVFKQYL